MTVKKLKKHGLHLFNKFYVTNSNYGIHDMSTIQYGILMIPYIHLRHRLPFQK